VKLVFSGRVIVMPWSVARFVRVVMAPRSSGRGVIFDNVLYPFLSLESFWIPHDEAVPRIIIKSRKLFMPFIIIFIEEVDPDKVREIMLRYIAETEHHESILKHVLEWFGF